MSAGNCGAPPQISAPRPNVRPVSAVPDAGGTSKSGNAEGRRKRSVFRHLEAAEMNARVARSALCDAPAETPAVLEAKWRIELVLHQTRFIRELLTGDRPPRTDDPPTNTRLQEECAGDR